MTYKKTTKFGDIKNHDTITAPNGKEYKCITISRDGIDYIVAEVALQNALLNEDGSYDPFDDRIAFYAFNFDTIGEIYTSLFNL